jgi:hypothetical protein
MQQYYKGNLTVRGENKAPAEAGAWSRQRVYVPERQLLHCLNLNNGKIPFPGELCKAVYAASARKRKITEK